MKKLTQILLVILAIFSMLFTLTACEEKYTVKETDALIAELQANIDANKNELDAKINTLITEYQAKDNEILEKIAQNEQALATLKTNYDLALKDLQDKDLATDQAIANLDTKYLEEVEKLNDSIDSLTTQLQTNKTELENKINGIKAIYDAKFSEIESILTTLQQSHEHTFGDMIAFGNDDNTCENKIFYCVCSGCNEVKFMHGTYNNHRWQTKYTTDNSFHWIKCNDCDAIKDRAEHSIDDSGYCTICNAVGGLLYDLSADGTYAEVIGYKGSAKNVIIAEEYNGKPVKSIYKEAFYFSSIKSVVIPDSVTSIGDLAFSNCRSLTSITIGDSVTSIGYRAFSDCNSSLYTIENNLKYVKANNNPYCILVEATNRNLSTYQINSQTQHIAGSVFSSCDSLTSVTIPDSVTSIGVWAFSDCNSLTRITIGNGVTSIGDYAFLYCNLLTSVTIPDSVTSIGYEAFYDCSKLTSVTIGNSVTSIGDDAFYSCESLTKVNYTGTIDDWAQIEFGNARENPLYYAKNLYINDVLVTEVVLTTATKISDYAFINCYSLTSVIIPDSVTSIGDYAFAYCDSLTSIKYCGSKYQWNSIVKDYLWDSFTGSYTIIYNYAG